MLAVGFEKMTVKMSEPFGSIIIKIAFYYIVLSMIVVAVCIYFYASESDEEDIEEHEVKENDIQPSFFLQELKANPCCNESFVT